MSAAVAVDLDQFLAQLGEAAELAKQRILTETSLGAQQAARSRFYSLSAAASEIRLHRQLVAQRSDRYLAVQSRATVSAAALDGMTRELAEAEREAEKLDQIKSPSRQRHWQTAQSLGVQLPAVQARADADRAAAQDERRALTEAQSKLDARIMAAQAALGE